MKLKQIARGPIVPIVTPRNFSEIFPLMEHVLSGGVSTIVFLGTTGEALHIPHEMKKKMIPQVAAFMKGKGDLIVGINAHTLKDAIELMQIASEAGAIACMVAPALFEGDPASTIRDLLTSTRGSLMLYNYPALAKGRSLPLEAIKPFLKEKRVMGIKDSSGDFAYFDALLTAREGDHFKIYYGRESGLLEAFRRNIDGFVPSSGNLEPQMVQTVWEKKRPFSEWHDLREQIKSYSPENYIRGTKELLKEKGILTNAELYQEEVAG